MSQWKTRMGMSHTRTMRGAVPIALPYRQIRLRDYRNIACGRPRLARLGKKPGATRLPGAGRPRALSGRDLIGGGQDVNRPFGDQILGLLRIGLHVRRPDVILERLRALPGFKDDE